MEKIAEFTIHRTQYLDPEGKELHDLPDFAKDASNLIELYRVMTLTRTLDTKAVALQRTGKMGTYASTLGQEAIATAIGHAMKKEDLLAPYYRDYAAQLQRGVKLSELYAYWGGDERGNNYENAHEDFPISVPIATQCLHAAGAATAFKLRKQKRVAVTTIGEGGTSEGAFYEAMNVAGAWQLPVVFVVNNNQWAISVPIEKQTACETIAQKAIAAGIEGEQVDGNDVIALRERIGIAIEKARDGGGPTLIEALTYRLCDHTTADDAKRYRDEAQVKKAWELEPLIRLKQYMIAQDMWDEDKDTTLKEQCAKEVDAGVDEYMSMDREEASAMFDSLYAELPEALKEQRAHVMEASNA